MVNTTAFILRKEPDASVRNKNKGVYFRLVRERDTNAKRVGFETALAALRSGQPHAQAFSCLQGDFDAVPGQPWAYWAPTKIREIFQVNRRVSALAKPWVGIQTSDNHRFLRYWWEVGVERIARFCVNAEEADGRGLNWKAVTWVYTLDKPGQAVDLAELARAPR
jgi:hypothetical protein